MRIFHILILLIATFNLYSQTPSFSVKFRLEEIMYDGDTCNSKYSIILKRCEFHKPEIKYSHDSSKIDWKNFPEDTNKFSCKLLNIYSKQSYVNDYYFRNHDYPFENIIKIEIFREKCDKLDIMYITFPVKIEAFVTMVEFGTVYFSPGKYDLTDNMEYTFNEKGYLVIKPKENILPK
jgi:hypothetical protein